LTDAAGNTTEVVSWNADGQPTEVLRSSGSGSTAITESFLSTYVSLGVNAGLLDTVTQRTKIGTGSWTTTRSTQYSYYDGTSGPGQAGDLKLAEVKDASGNVINTNYYRYFTSGAGSAGKMAYTFGTQAYGLLTAEMGTDLDSLTDTQVAPFADKALTYDSSGRVATVVDAAAGCSVCSGGQGTFGYTYTSNPSSPAPGENVWAMKTVETLPDGSTNTVYTNGFGQVMLQAFQDVNGTDTWITYSKFNSSGQTILVANPSAVTGYDDSYADLVHYVSGNAQYLSDTDGLITTYAYPTTTTTTTSTAGDVVGYLKETDIQHGETGTPIPQGSMNYIANTAAGATVYKVASSTVYRNDDGTGAETTSYAYTFFSGTNQIQSAMTTLPAISTVQNGSGTADSVTTVMDQFGRPIWTQDQAGYLTYVQYDDATGAVVKTITDVDTTQTSEFANLPSGWTTPTGGGRNLITSYEVDSLGRVTKETSPEGRITFTVYSDAAHEVRMYSGWDSSTNLPTGPTTVSRRDLANGYTETLTMSATPNVSGGVPTGTEAIANVQSLSRSYTNDAGQVVYSDSYFNLGGLAYSTAANIGTEGVNFYRTRFQYDDKGNLTRTVSPQGTISRTVYDGQSRPVSQWVGTDDTPTSGYWSPTNLTGTNMVKVADYEYDNGGVGDGNLTQMTEHPGGSAADRVTQSWFDWRNRTVAVKAGVESSESSDVNRLLSYTNFDNLGEVIETRLYDADGVTPSIVDGVPQPLSSSLLRADSTTTYDDLGRVYRTDTYSVDPSTGAVSTDSLHTDRWYDSRGYVIKSASPSGSVDKEVYDGAGFNTASYITNGGGDSSYADAGNVTGDIVLMQTDNTFDNDGNVIETATHERFHDATGTGELGTPTSGVPARVSYMGYYFDLGNRLTDAVDVGTNGGTAWTRPSSVPSRSDTVLVTSQSYAADALQTVKLTGSPTGGTFTLTFGGQTTSGIAYNASASTVQSALAALSSVGSGNVVVSPAVNGGWEVRFSGSLGGLFQNQMTADGSGLTGGTSPSVAVNTLSLGGDAGNVVDTTDPKGLVSRTYSDPLGRDVQDIENFTDGIVTDNSNVTTDYTYNSVGQTSLTAEQADGTGQTTAWVYGVSPATGSTITSNDIVGTTEYPDPTTGLPSSSSSEEESSTVDALGETTTTTDRNGNVHTLSYDVLGRVVSDAVTTLGAGVDGSVRRIDTAYDSQGNPYLVTSYDAVTGGSIVNQVEDVYNGLGQLTAEYQQNGGAVNTSTSPVVLYSYSEMSGGMNASRLTSMTYPSGYVLNYNYDSGLDDSISRLSSISDSTGTLESYAFLGLGTVVERDHPQPGLDLSYVSPTSSTGDAGDQYTGLDRFGRVAEQLWTNAASTAVSDFLYGYDRNSNAVYRDDQVNTSFGELYTYDGLNQLSSFQRGTLNSTKDGITGTTSQSQNWNYDALGNWNSVTTDGSTQTRTANAQNEITSISGATTPTYDSNGNMTGDETGKTFVYDAWNRLVAVKTGSTVLETFGYDGMNRRVSQTVGSTTTNLIYSDQDQVLEEQIDGETTMRYVWSPVYVNAMILRDRATTTPGTLDERLWVMQDANWNVIGLVDGSGNVVERYAYTPFGVQTIYDATYNVRSGGSAYGFGYGFQGMRFDAVSGLNEADERWYSSTLGRWTSNDPIGFAGGEDNLYGMVGDNPVNATDSSGQDIDKPPVKVHQIDWKNVVNLLNKTDAGKWALECYLFHSSELKIIVTTTLRDVYITPSGGKQILDSDYGATIGKTIYLNNSLLTSDLLVAETLGHELVHACGQFKGKSGKVTERINDKCFGSGEVAARTWEIFFAYQLKQLNIDNSFDKNFRDTDLAYVENGQLRVRWKLLEEYYGPKSGYGKSPKPPAGYVYDYETGDKKSQQEIDLIKFYPK
jgi:RHS repeat-associated protein